MNTWVSMTVLERALIRSALLDVCLDDAVEYYGIAQRWEGIAGAPQRSYRDAEIVALVPEAASALLRLAGDGLIEVRQIPGGEPGAEGTLMDLEALRGVVMEPSHWLARQNAPVRHRLSAPEPVFEAFHDEAFPFDPGLPPAAELNPAQHEILLCAKEFSGMLTGPFGIWDPPSAFLGPDARLAWADERLAELMPFVRRGLIEVRLFAGDGTYTVISESGLRYAFAHDTGALWPDGDDYFTGATCVLTFAGLAFARAGRSQYAYGRRHAR